MEQQQGQKRDAAALRALVKEGYGKVAQKEAGCCGGPVSCGDVGDVGAHALRLGYEGKDIEEVGEGANLGLGCGNPTALASLGEGDVVLDLGSGAGFDALIAARQVGDSGRVIGVDMTPEMLKRARENAVKSGFSGTVEFREGLIEELPVVDESVDVVISNCVINLSPDKASVFREAYRVLRPGGRLAVSDILLTEPLSQEVLDLAEGYIGCVSGASLQEEYFGQMKDAGFVDVEWTRVEAAPLLLSSADPLLEEAKSTGGDWLTQEAKKVWSYKIQAHKPA